MENVSEVKLAKFEIMIEETSKWFYSYQMPLFGVGYALMPFYLPIMDEKKVNRYLENKYFKKIYDLCYEKDDSYFNPLVGPRSDSLVNDIKYLRSAEVINSKLRIFGSSSHEFKGYQIRGGMIFLALLLAAVNDDFYSNEINMISDLAYMLGFTEDMMSDWVAAVKYLLDGNRFSETMPLEFKTPEANKFFKHK